MINLDLVEHTTQLEALKNKGGLITDSISPSGAVANGGKVLFEKAISLPSGTDFLQSRVTWSADSGKRYSLDTWLNFWLDSPTNTIWLEPFVRIAGSTAYISAELINQSGAGYTAGASTLTFYLRPFVSPF